MKYNFKRALGISLAFYVATMVVGIVCGMILGDEISAGKFPESFWYISMVAAVILTAAFAAWYFKNPAILPSAKSGFLFGLTAVVVSFLLDLLFFSIGNMSSNPETHVDLGQYYGDYRFWVIVVLVIATAKLVGYKKNRVSTV